MKKQMQDILQKQFGLENFREGQQEIIESIVGKKDTLVFMPTGGGKSLTYQLPGMMMEGITIVISPLISLMKDQVDTLRKLGIRTELINSTLSGTDKAEIMNELKYYDSSDIQAIKFLYIAPERLNSNEFIGILKTVKIGLVAIDEAHCISQWGHDFRPSYMKIKGFIDGLAQAHPPILNSFPPGEKEATSFSESKRKYIIDLARDLRKQGTKEEEILWEVLRSKKLGYKFRRQHLFGRYIADFYCDELKVVIELDGKIHKNQKEYDSIRDEIISQYGVRILRIENHQIHENLDKVIEKTLSLSPSGGKMSEGQIGGDVAQRSFPVVGLTATATHKVREDIVERLGLTEYKSFISGFDRKNIIIVVREISAKEEKQAKVLNIVEKTPGSGIIYCSSRKHVIELSDYLISKGVKTGVYKGDLSPEKREEQQNKFMNDEYKVMVATNAFGMGIDKKDIRFVVHYNLPGSIENYYQEVGRAGRDGKMSYGIVLASYGDTKIQEFFIDNTYPDKKQVLDFYDYLYKEYKLGEGKGSRVAKTYYAMASESGVGNDMIVGSIIKILEKYNILRRGLEESDRESDFRGRGLTLLQEKRQHAHLLIDWKRQNLLKDEAYYKLEQIKRLLFYPSCRKRFILEYFGDTEDLATLGDNCGLCDYCLESQKFDEQDLEKVLPSSSYGLVLETVKKYNEKFGQTLLSKVLVGSHDKRIEDWGLDAYEHHGALQEYSLAAVGAIFESLHMEGFLCKTDGKYPTVGVTELGGAAVYKDKYIKDRLQDLNKYVLQKVGKEIGKKGKTRDARGSIKKTSTLKGQTYNDTLELFKAGKTLKEISLQRDLGMQTIESHIVTLYERGDISLIEVMNLIDFDNAKIIKISLESDAILEQAELKPIKQKLEKSGNKDISYFDIKLTLAMIQKGDL